MIPIGASSPMISSPGRAAGRGRGAGSRLQPHSVGSGTVKVTFKIPHRCSFGDTVKVVGNGPRLGNWNVGDGIPLKWQEGDVWICDAELEPQGSGLIEYKYVVEHPTGQVSWMDGDNMSVQLPSVGSDVLVSVIDSWDRGQHEVIIDIPTRPSAPDQSTPPPLQPEPEPEPQPEAPQAPEPEPQLQEVVDNFVADPAPPLPDREFMPFDDLSPPAEPSSSYSIGGPAVPDYDADVYRADGIGLGAGLREGVGASSRVHKGPRKVNRRGSARRGAEVSEEDEPTEEEMTKVLEEMAQRTMRALDSSVQEAHEALDDGLDPASPEALEFDAVVANMSKRAIAMSRALQAAKSDVRGLIGEGRRVNGAVKD